MRISIRDALALTTIFALLCTVIILARRVERLKRLTYPEGYTYYSGEPSGKKYSVTIQLTGEEFAELYPDEWQYVVKPGRVKWNTGSSNAASSSD